VVVDEAADGNLGFRKGEPVLEGEVIVH
jgi:hypothetical protein